MTTTDTPRAQAVAWLVGRLQQEAMLAALHRRAEAAGGPIDLDVESRREPVAA